MSKVARNPRRSGRTTVGSWPPRPYCAAVDAAPAGSACTFLFRPSGSKKPCGGQDCGAAKMQPSGRPSPLPGDRAASFQPPSASGTNGLHTISTDSRSLDMNQELDVLDIDRWVKQFPHPPEEGGFGCLITGPADIAHVVQLRSEALKGTSDLAAVPCDIFVFAQGEPTRRDVTKVNGVPYRPAALPWPVTADGAPMTFLAQFRFTESADLTGKLPGDILVVFISDDDLYPFDQPQETLRFEWYPLGLNALVA